ncbi:hypothetical protein SLEP1_g13967 [Rubroshorea leprosula]|uniref:Small ribosomal subunit protein mS41 SAM domain-containing protein n=1 Tax=Rubroshorea leprosula TaxID=152421 RepID=A0AAV5IHL2_9ROSI|nr:hypothetical protein SLEP1_g13967 [Rubroshorea leprosula]
MGFLDSSPSRLLLWVSAFYHFPSHSGSHINVGKHKELKVEFRFKVGIPEFLNGVGGGVEAHVVKLELEIGDFQKLLVTSTLKLKKLGIPCKHRKPILKYAHKYRLGLWRPQAEPAKA